MLNNCPDDSNISLINAIYHKPKKGSNGKYGKDAITLVYKDNNTNNTLQETIKEPTYEYYIYKDDNVCDHNQLFEYADRLEKIEVPYNDLLKDIADRTNNLDFFYDNIRSGQRYENRLLHTDPKVFRSDMHIEDYIRFKFTSKYGMNYPTLTKSYIDIEVDTINSNQDFPDLGECPINAITVIDGVYNNVHTYLLRNKENPLVENLENSLKKDSNIFFSKIKDTIISAVGGEEKYDYYKLDKLDFNIYFFDDEVELIYSVFNMINETKPNFILAWNMAFDIPYIIERLKKLKVDPVSVLCHKDFEIKECFYYIDERNLNESGKRGDFAKISSYSVYLDQLIHFISRRLTQSAIKRESLEYVGQLIAGVNKYDYSHITTDISEFPYLDYELFVIYNIIDTIVQKCIEERVDDIGYVYQKSIINNTRYEKCHRNTIYLKNRGNSEFIKDNLIIGNNSNLKTPREGYPGGLVANPLNVIPNGMVLNGVYVDIYKNVIDYDYKSLYPSMMVEFGIAPNTMVGRLLLNEGIRDNENRYGDPDYTPGGSFIRDIISKNFNILGSRWFKLPTYDELYKLLEIYFMSINNNIHNEKGLLEVINIDTNQNVFSPIFFVSEEDKLSPITLYKPLSKNIKIGGSINDNRFFQNI